VVGRSAREACNIVEHKPPTHHLGTDAGHRCGNPSELWLYHRLTSQVASNFLGSGRGPCIAVPKEVLFGLLDRVPLKNSVFWDVTPCGSCKDQHFGGM
jgi:hypothetical protein